MKRIRPGGDGIKPNEDNTYNRNNSIRDSSSTNNNPRSSAERQQNIINRTTESRSSSSAGTTSSPPPEHDGSNSDSNMGIPDSQMDARARVMPLRERDASDDNSHGSDRSMGSNNSGGNASTALEANNEQAGGGGCSSSGGSATASSENDLATARTTISSNFSREAAADRNDEIMESAGATGDDGGATVGGAHQLNVFVLVRLLFHYLEKVDPQLLLEAKRALKDCDRRKREGDPGYQQLSEVIPRRLRRIVGDKHWGRALAIQRNYLLQKKRKKKQRDEMMQHRRQMSRSREKFGLSANPNVVSMDSSTDTIGQASATSTAAASAASASAASTSASAQKHPPENGSNSVLPSSPSPPVMPNFNPGLLRRVVEQSASGDGTTSSASTSRAGNGDSTTANNNLAHIPSPFEVAQRALAAQVEAYNRASTQMGLETQMHQQALGFPPSAEGQAALPASVAAAAWQGRMPMSSCHTDDSSESSSS